MKWFSVSLLLAAVVLVDAVPQPAPPRPPPGQVKCKQKDKLQRRAWHTLSKKQKLEYLDAEKCLMKKPAKYGLPGTRTRFDELVATHVMQAEWTHGVGQFLPFHRFLMHTHEFLLRTQCGYKGAQPYWDEPPDAGSFRSSPLLDPVSGFGGDGSGPNNCITDGPFKDYILPLGPGHLIQDHCIDRKIDEGASGYAAQRFVDDCMPISDYDGFWSCLDGGPHFGGHGGMGMTMMNPISSPGDPLFYLHHTYLDKLWHDWQTRYLPGSLTDITARNIPDLCRLPPMVNNTAEFPFPRPPPPGPVQWPVPPTPDAWCPPPEFEFEFPEMVGDPGNMTTLGHVLSMKGIVPNVTVGEVMDIGGPFLCYEYV